MTSLGVPLVDILILLITIISAAFGITIFILIYGMGPFRSLFFYKGSALVMTNPDNSYYIAKLRTLRKALKVYFRHGQQHLFRCGVGTGYNTVGGPRLYFGYSPAEMAANTKLVPWAKRVLHLTKEKWDVTPQNWEQLCLAYYKDHIEQALSSPDPELDSTAVSVLKADRALIEEIETGRPRPLIDQETGRQYADQQGRPLFHPPVNIEEKEALVDRAEDVMITENPDVFRFENVDLKEVVLFRRSTFTDSDIDDAYAEGFAKAKETSSRDTLKIFVITMAFLWSAVGIAIILTVLKGGL